MNEKAEGRLISFFRFNKSLATHPPLPAFFTSTILFPMALDRRSASTPSFLLAPTQASVHHRHGRKGRESRYRTAVRKELLPNQNSFP